MKKLISILTLLFVTLSLVACSSNTATTTTPETTAEATAETTAEATGETKLDQILAKGTLVVALSPDYPPMEFLDNDGNAIGSDISLANYIAEQLGVKLEILTMDFSSTFVSLDSGKADLVISGLGYTLERSENYELSIGYNFEDGAESSCQGLIFNTTDVDKYKTFEDMDGIAVAAQANSLQEMYSKEQIPNVKLEPVTDIGTGIMSLQTGKVDAVALSCELAKGYANTLEGVSKSDVEFVLHEDETSGNVIAAKKGETALIDKIDEILKGVNDQGLFVGWHQEAKDTASELGIDFGE